ncbi:MAG: hypothetical protein IT348_10190 [Candidatus Eisenbacteria bacterium]|nr:hypothetical protein [Candidatus Eisenbacteria bacterium]
MSLPKVQIKLDSADDLREYGFVGFRTTVQLREEDCMSIPSDSGAWVVLREWTTPPKFMPKSSAGIWRRQSPTVSPEELAAKWVEDACVLYIGHAPGPGVRNRLQQRIKRFIRFGTGKAVAHWSGRYIWQLSGAAALRFAWYPCDKRDSDPLVNRMFKAFDERYGTLPFANLEMEEQEFEE